jgi:hypothetical protein
MQFVMSALATREEKLMIEGCEKPIGSVVFVITQKPANNAAKIRYRTNAAENPEKGHRKGGLSGLTKKSGCEFRVPAF